MGKIPSNITKEHLLKAIEEIDLGGIPAEQDSTKHDLLFNNRRYPPKLVIRLANKFANGDELWDFSGGPQTNDFLQSFGFTIVPKNVTESKNMTISELFKEILVRFPDEYKKDRKVNNPYFKELKQRILSHLSPLATKYGYTIQALGGQGTMREEPYIIFLAPGHKASHGIYPQIVFYPAKKSVYLCIGDPYMIEPEKELADKLTSDARNLLPQFKERNDDGYPAITYPLASLNDETINNDLASLFDAHQTLLKKYAAEIKAYLQQSKTSSGNEPEFKLNAGKFESVLRSYLDTCQNTNWLKEEVYKFNFAHWLAERVNFDIQKDEEIFDICIESQQQKYIPSSNEKGVNFIVSSSRFSGKYLDINDVKIFRKYWEKGSLTEEDISKSGLTYPKLTVWLGTLFPESNVPYARDELINGVAYLFDLQDFPKKGYHSFQLANQLNRILKAELKKHADIVEPVVQPVYQAGPLTELDWSWLTQDLNLFIVRKYLTNISESDAEAEEIFESDLNYSGLRYPLNQILYGPPGTGKTYQTKTFAVSIIENEAIDLSYDRSMQLKRFDGYYEKGQIDFVTFHQSFSYEDFIEGIKPKLIAENDLEKNTEKDTSHNIAYEICDGVFKQLAKKARSNHEKRYVLIIDEINRGNIAQIFGELITLIEADKRAGQPEALSALLPYSKTEFSVPDNLYIIGTMNTADRSVEALDTALRRRFAFVEISPEPGLLSGIECGSIDLVKLLTAINLRIEKLIDKDHCIGHSYFLRLKDATDPLADLKNIFANNILPLLKEYFYGDFGKIGLILGKSFVETSTQDTGFEFAVFDYDDGEELKQRTVYRIKPLDEMQEEDFIQIYEPRNDQNPA